MPFRKIVNRQKKIASAKTRILVFFFIFGISITLFVSFLIQKNQNREKYIQLNSIGTEFSRNFENMILNSTLRIQWMLEKFDIQSKNVSSQRQVIEEIIQRTIFQRMTIFRKKTDSKGKEVWNRVFFSQSPEDHLPTPTNPNLSSELLIKKIELMRSRKQVTAFALNVRDNRNYINLMINPPSNPNEFIFFTSPLESVLKNDKTASGLEVFLADPDTQLTFVISLNQPKPKFKTLEYYANHLHFQKMKQNRIVSRIDLMSSLDFAVYGQIKKTISHLTLVTFIVGLLITLLITLLLRFIIEQNQLVADLVVMRTLDLEDALNRATEADFAKNRFLANISHELRTPLNLILGMLELIEEKSHDSKILDYIQTVRSSGNHLLSLISDLLDVAQKNDEIASATKKVPIKSPFFFEEIVQLMSAECRKKRIDFRFDLADDVPEYFRGDPAKVRQILINLLRNAIKYTTSGFVELKVSTNKMSTTNHKEKMVTLRMAVKDSGVGIPIDKQQQVFERFLQLDSTKILSQGGVGLGLSIVKDLVNKLEGNILVTSEPFVGSEFTVDLDFEVVDQVSWKQRFIDLQESDLNLAVVSDDLQICKTIKNTVESLKTSISFISTEMFTSDLLTKNKYSHVILDQSAAKEPLINHLKYLKKNLIIIGDDKELEKTSPLFQFKILDNFPLLPTSLWSALGITHVNSKSRSSITKQFTNKEENIARNVKLNILIADDDEGNRNLMNAYFSELNWNLTFVENGEDAYKMYQEKRPDIIIADLRMPIVDGFQMTDLIRSYEKSHNLLNTPIVLVTADALKETQQESIKHQVNYFLTKPVRKSKIIETILLAHQS